jgi:hypothetical protein
MRRLHQQSFIGCAGSAARKKEDPSFSFEDFFYFSKILIRLNDTVAGRVNYRYRLGDAPGRARTFISSTAELDKEF